MRNMLLVALALVFARDSASGQDRTLVSQPRSTTSGLFLGFSLNGSAVNLDEVPVGGTPSGVGASLGLGYGFNRVISAYLEGAVAPINIDGDAALLSHVDAGARFHFANRERSVIPFLDVGVTRRAINADDVPDNDRPGTSNDQEFAGTVLTAGGGVLYFFDPRWAVNGNARFTNGEFDQVKLNGRPVQNFSFFSVSTRLNLGVTWFPTGGR
jgi:hypothetical protein